MTITDKQIEERDKLATAMRLHAEAAGIIDWVDLADMALTHARSQRAAVDWATEAAKEVTAAGPQKTRPLAEFIAEQREMRETRQHAEDMAAEAARLGEALEEIAKQELSADMSVDDQLGGDFEGAYDHIIELARSALRSHRGEPAKGWIGRGINDPDAGA